MASASMMRIAIRLTGTTVTPDRRGPLDDALEDLRITGSVLLHEAYAPPWAIAVPDEARLRTILRVGADTRVLLFHFVRRGRFELRMKGHATKCVEAGEVAICATGAAHSMSLGRGGPALPLESVLNGVASAGSAGRHPDATELVCGAFFAHAAPLNPMLGALPPVVKVSTTDASFSPMLSGVAWMLAHELNRGALGGFTAARVIELLCAESIRAYQRSAGAEHVGWFKGLSDSRVSEAIRCIHAAPDKRWTVEGLAAKVALSPSRFAARFRGTVGRSVMAYVAAWRANVACRLLRETTLALGEIAGRVGYESLPAFSRAFKAQMGQAPAAWRAAQVRTSDPGSHGG
jgi:AraC-like DNA-binding protein